MRIARAGKVCHFFRSSSASALSMKKDKKGKRKRVSSHSTRISLNKKGNTGRKLSEFEVEEKGKNHCKKQEKKKEKGIHETSQTSERERRKTISGASGVPNWKKHRKIHT